MPYVEIMKPGLHDCHNMSLAVDNEGFIKGLL